MMEMLSFPCSYIGWFFLCEELLKKYIFTSLSVYILGKMRVAKLKISSIQ